MRQFVRSLFARKSSSARQGKNRPATAHLGLEGLEDRTVPTVVFHPHFGETQAPGSSYGSGGMVSPPVFLVFWGSNWGKSQDSNAYISATRALLSSGYLSGLNQYGSDGTASVGTSWVDNSDAPAGFTTGDLRNFLQGTIDNDDTTGIVRPSTPPHDPIYVVITDSKATSAQPGAGGYNAQGTYYHGLFGWQTNTMHEVWVSTQNTTRPSADIDRFTSVLSHELAETISNPAPGQGFTVQTSGPAIPGEGNQIGDYEAEGFGQGQYLARVNGVLVQPYWSQRDAAFIAPDGHTQSIDLYPSWTASNTFNKTYALSINGDQRGAGFADIVTVDTTAAGGVLVNLNGESFSFEPGQIQSITVNTGSGSNTVYVRNNTVPVFVNDGGPDTVYLGNSSTGAQGIRADVTVTNPPSRTALTIDDTADVTAARSAHMGTAPTGPAGWGYVSGLAPADIHFKYADVSSLTVNTGSVAGNYFGVWESGVPTTVIGHASASVSIGDGLAGVQNIHGDVTVLNPPSRTALTIDDTADSSAARSAHMGTAPVGPAGWGYVSGLAPFDIHFKYADVSSLTVNTGSVAGNYFGVWESGVPTTVIGHASASVSIGDGLAGLQNIQGAVTVLNPPSRTTLTIDDRADPSGRMGTLNQATVNGDSHWENLSGLAPANIYYHDYDISSIAILLNSTSGVAVQNNGGVWTTVNGQRR